MRNRSFNIAIAGAIVAAISFTAVPAQLIFASRANAGVQSEEVSSPKNDTYWFHWHTGSSNEHCKVNVWGHILDC
ncbi:MAG: hypothetical protein ACLP7P_18715 [Rhodomicrobium sp.]